MLLLSRNTVTGCAQQCLEMWPYRFQTWIGLCAISTEVPSLPSSIPVIQGCHVPAQASLHLLCVLGNDDLVPAGMAAGLLPEKQLIWIRCLHFLFFFFFFLVAESVCVTAVGCFPAKVLLVGNMEEEEIAKLSNQGQKKARDRKLLVVVNVRHSKDQENFQGLFLQFVKSPIGFSTTYSLYLINNT